MILGTSLGASLGTSLGMSLGNIVGIMLMLGVAVAMLTIGEVDVNSVEVGLISGATAMATVGIGVSTASGGRIAGTDGDCVRAGGGGVDGGGGEGGVDDGGGEGGVGGGSGSGARTAEKQLPSWSRPTQLPEIKFL
jgi:hypothetical protein